MRVNEEEFYGTYSTIKKDETQKNLVAEQLVNNVINDQEQDIRKKLMKYRAAMFLCGLINNTGYVLVSTSAQSVAKHFKKEDLMSAFNFSLIFLSMGMVTLNAKLLLRVKHKIRVYVAITLTAVSFVIIGMWYKYEHYIKSTSIDQSWAFWVALLGTTLCGCMQAFGETTMLGYCKCFSSQLIGLWSSGTGFAGIFGSGFYITLKALKFTDFYVFVTMIPFLFIYLFSFSWLESRRITFKDEQGVINDSVATSIEDESTNNLKMNWKNTSFVLTLAWSFSLNLGLVYFFEYFCLTSWADRANKVNEEDQDFLHKNAFAILSFCYQVGVFISRSSLEFIKIPKVWILTTIQGFNCIVWAFIAIGHYYELYRISLIFQFILMVWVGLMGGASYVNVNYLIVSGNTLPQNCKELCMNMNSITNNFGIMLATLSALAVSNFWLN